MNSISAQINLLLTDSRVQQLKQAIGPAAELFLVGGCIRDLLSGKTSKDLDLTCRIKADEVLGILTSQGIRCLETGVRHGTVTAVFEGSNLEITSFRGEQKPEYSPEEALKLDLSLRDFTINSIALSINTGTLHDPFNGAADLSARILRALPKASEKFKDDPLRILRMVRFGPADNFTIEDSTYQAARELVELIKPVSMERVQHEFSKILMSDNPRAALNCMLDLRLLEIYFPEALPSVNFEQNEFHTEDVFNHTLSVIENTPKDLNMRLAAFFHDLGKPKSLSVDDDGKRHFYEHEIYGAEICSQVMPRLKYSNDLTKSVTRLVKYHMRPIDCGPAGIRRLMRDLAEDFPKWRKFKEADHTPSIPVNQTLAELNEFDNKVSAELERQALEKQKKLVVDGNQLMALGLNAGPKLGKLIKILEEEVIEDPSHNQEQYLLNRAKELIAKNQL